MLLVKTEIKISNIDGIGLFAAEFIPAKIIIWEFTPGFDLKFSREDIDNFPLITRQFLSKYVYFSDKSDKFILANDNAKYFNDLLRA
jgi:uncharacterized protein